MDGQMTGQATGQNDINILEQLMEQNPLMKSGIKRVQKNQDQHIDEAMKQGVPAEQILQQLINKAPSAFNQGGIQTNQQGQNSYTMPGWFADLFTPGGARGTQELQALKSLTESQKNQSMSQMMNPQQVAERTKQADEALQAQGLTDYKASVGAKGQIMTSKQTAGMGSSLIKFAEKNAPLIADAVSNGDFSGYMNSDRYTKSATARVLQERGISITPEELSYKAKVATTPNAKVQGAKVDQAIHLRQMLDQSYNSDTKEYNVKDVPYQELAMGLASLVSNNNQTTDQQRKSIAQKTAAGDINGLITYLTGAPQNAAPQKVIKMLADAIDRQGITSENLRDRYIGKSKYGNSFSEYLKNSPSQQKSQGKQYVRTGKNSQGQKVGQLADGTIEVIQ